MDLSFYRGKNVFITGHTGFKGAYLTTALLLAGANVHGYALAPPTEPSLFALLQIDQHMHSVTGDVRDAEHLREALLAAKPEIVFHLAAQPIVRTSYELPRETYETNVMGTVHLLDALRQTDSVISLVNVTTDKVYLNREREEGYAEDEELCGYDPYSNSKSCSELVTYSFRQSFFADGPAIATARAGNVIGGGDFAKDRLIPDCVRAMEKKEEIVLRHPEAVRPFQHVFEPLAAYLQLAEAQAKDASLAGAYNVGPDEGDIVTAGEMADLFCAAWGEGASWRHMADEGPHEATLLRLKNDKIKQRIGWVSKMNIKAAIDATVAWSKAYLAAADVRTLTETQIKDYFEL